MMLTKIGLAVLSKISFKIGILTPLTKFSLTTIALPIPSVSLPSTDSIPQPVYETSKFAIFFVLLK
jgi:hypothetical protein